MTTEFIRVLGLLPVVVGRDEHVVGASGATLLRTMLVQLALEDVAVEDRGGALHLRALLPDERYRAIAGLPPVLANRDAVIEAHTAAARIFIPLAESLAARCGAEFPAEFYAATREHWSRGSAWSFDAERWGPTWAWVARQWSYRTLGRSWGSTVRRVVRLSPPPRCGRARRG